MNILIRADSSSTIGTGHIMRDLVLAKQLTDEYTGANIVFASLNLSGNINFNVLNAGYKLITLQSNSKTELEELIKKLQIDMVVFDNYSINYKFEKYIQTRTNVLIFSLDDTYEKHYCDIVLNQNIYADSSKYKTLVPKHCQLRCGPKFTLLREEFYEQRDKYYKKNKLKNVLIAMGGADNRNLNIKILKVLKKFKNIQINIVTTQANKNLKKLKQYIAQQPNITLHINTAHIAQLMRSSDFAIITPSVTANECYFMRVPFIAIQTADNQKQMYDFLHKQGFAVLNKFKKNKLKKLVLNKIKKKAILKNFTDLSYRQKVKILLWRNNKLIRKRMYHSSKLTLKEHLKFIDTLEFATDKQYFLVSFGKKEIGVINFVNISKKSCEIGIYANPKLHGVGDIIMSAIINFAFEKLKVKKLRAEVFADNDKAIKLYKRFGFGSISQKVYENKTVIIMELRDEDR